MAAPVIVRYPRANSHLYAHGITIVQLIGEIAAIRCKRPPCAEEAAGKDRAEAPRELLRTVQQLLGETFVSVAGRQAMIDCQRGR